MADPNFLQSICSVFTCSSSFLSEKGLKFSQ
jgi:hypothetical protein